MNATPSNDAEPTEPAAPPVVRLLRPEAGELIVAGAHVNGIGWVSAGAQIEAVEIHLGITPRGLAAPALHPIGLARLGLSADELFMLTGEHPPEGMTGFVFALVAPALPAGPVTMRAQARTSAGPGTHDVELILEHPAGGIAAPLAAAESDGRAPIRAIIETARVDETGILRLSGWAAGLVPIERIDVEIGGRVVGMAQWWMPRADLAEILAGYEDAAEAGFLFHQELDDEALGQSEARVVVATRDGAVRSFAAPLARPGAVRRRAREQVANIVCDEVDLTENGRLAVKGWAVVSSGAPHVQVHLGETLVGVVTPTEDRPDVGNNFPLIPAARRSGFRLERQLEGAFTGDHVVRLSVTGREGEESACYQPVFARPWVAEPVAPPAPDLEAFKFFLDAPACKDGFAIETVRGFLSIAGWAIARDGIDRIEVFVDGVSQGRAHHGIRREDLQAAFPEYDALRAGFAMMLPPQVMKKGTRAVRVDICDKAGRVKEISFSVRADAAASGPGPWLTRRKLPQAEIDLLHDVLRARGPAPSWTVLLTVPDATPATLAAIQETVESLRWQAYEDWSLLVLPDKADAVVLIEAALQSNHADLSPRLRVLPPQPATIPPRALADLGGDFLVPLCPGDRLGEDALLELGLAAGAHPGTDFLYSDERRIDPADGAEKAFFKPDFSPDLLLSTNYIGRVWAAAAPLIARVGLTETDLRTHGHYDAVLRLTEQASAIHHVGKVLCARADCANKTWTGESKARERAALQRAMRRRDIRGALEAGPIAGTWRVRRDVAAAAQAKALVSIIIPTIASRGFIKTAIESIRAHTNWPAYEIICLDNLPRNGSEEQQGWKQWIAANADRTVEIADKFNWSRFNNIGAKAARGAYLLFLNDDVEVSDPDWLAGLVEHAQRPEVGVVGPQLLYPDGRVQHAGMFLARNAARHAFRFYPRDEPGPFGLALTQRNVISVTGACMMMRRAVFDALGGFDEAHAVVNNDLDFNLRVRAAGHSVVYTPAVSLVHHEMVSRAEIADIFDSKRFVRDWGDLFLKGDPFFNHHLSPDCDDYLPDPEPVRVFAAGHPLIAREKIRRILAVKLDHIGDFITAFPAFRRIKERFPGAELTVLAAKASLSLAAMEPAIDRVIEFNFYHARSEKGRLAQAKRELANLRATLEPQRFDLAIDLRRQPDTRPILQVSGARWLAGFETAYEHPWLDIAVEFEGDIALHLKRSHVADSLVGLIDAVSTQCEVDRRIVGNPLDRAAARGVLDGILAPQAGAPAKLAATREAGGAVRGDARALVCVHTGAGAINKQWPAASFAALIDLLISDAGAEIMIIGGPDETAFAASVLKLVRRRSDVTNLVGRTSLSKLPAVLRASDLYVGNDSGPKHMAAALGVPTIGIHSGSVDAGEWGPVGPHALTIRRDVTCSPCYLARAADCHRALACLEGIGVRDVFAACQRMLALCSPRVAAIAPHVDEALEQAAD
jgi:ADP-heptose:LPS heptosyltransferase/GT2 family glycosyltransferase